MKPMDKSHGNNGADGSNGGHERDGAQGGKVSKPAAPKKQGPRCPICDQPAREAHRPFCSKRCADVDLNRWLRGVYAIPGAAVEAQETSAPRNGEDGGDEDEEKPLD